MKRIFFFILFSSLAISAQAQNVGIGTTAPSQKFTVRQDGIGITQESSAGAVQIGFFIRNTIAQLQTHTNHPLAFSTNGGGTSHMLLSTTGNFGIGTGTSSPTLAGLVADKKVGAVNALFGSNTTGVAIESSNPGFGFNTYYNAGRKSISAGYGGWMGLDTNTGDLILQSSAAAGTAGSDINVTTKMIVDKNGLVGIGTAAPNPTAQLHVDVGSSTTKGLLVTGTNNFLPGVVPDLGAGHRLMFYPGKAAFRAGVADGTEWDNVNVGFGSVATGSGTTASYDYSTAMGGKTTANASFSTAMGYYTTASGSYSTAMGNNTIASGSSSNAMGENTIASGSSSTAMGENTVASGSYSTAMGYYTTASGDYSTAIGKEMRTNSKTGAFAVGDSDPNNEGFVNFTLADQFTARFWNGYYFLTSGGINHFGVSIGHNGNSWVSICDSNRKENIEPLNGEDVLQRLSNINFSSWNYKQQDPKAYRHYGVMAQDFYTAFGKDSYGAIGNDTTVNPIDMIGVDMAAIKALEKRTAELKSTNIELNSQNKKLELMIDKLEVRLKKLEGERK